MQQRLAVEGAEPSEITAAIARERVAYSQRFTQTVMQPCSSRCTRDDFERRNALSDARQDIAAQHVPVMVLMGAQDLNVSSKETLTVWSVTAGGNFTLLTRSQRCHPRGTARQMV